jgi:uncharacterized membrane protein YtjA (UPF0391 family)
LGTLSPAYRYPFNRQRSKGPVMLKWILILIVVVAVAGLFGMNGLAGVAGTGAKLLIAVALILFLLTQLAVVAIV